MLVGDRANRPASLCNPGCAVLRSRPTAPASVATACEPRRVMCPKCGRSPTPSLPTDNADKSSVWNQDECRAEASVASAERLPAARSQGSDSLALNPDAVHSAREAVGAGRAASVPTRRDVLTHDTSTRNARHPRDLPSNAKLAGKLPEIRPPPRYGWRRHCECVA